MRSIFARSAARDTGITSSRGRRTRPDVRNFIDCPLDGCEVPPGGGGGTDMGCFIFYSSHSSVSGAQGQLGEGQGEEVMELIEQARALADDGLQAASDLAEDAQFL